MTRDGRRRLSSFTPEARAALAVFAIALVAFLPSIATGFVFDDLPAGSTVESVVARARPEIPGIDDVPFAVAHNRELVREAARRTAVVHDGDELALLPPVSGG